MDHAGTASQGEAVPPASEEDAWLLEFERAAGDIAQKEKAEAEVQRPPQQQQQLHNPNSLNPTRILYGSEAKRIAAQDEDEAWFLAFEKAAEEMAQRERQQQVERSIQPHNPDPTPNPDSTPNQGRDRGSL